MANIPTFSSGSKVRIMLGRNGKNLRNPVYGYIRSVIKCEDAPDGFICTESGWQYSGFAYLIQTSWGGGMLWYSEIALQLAGGNHELDEWQKKLDKYHQKNET